jgi:Sulfatase
MRKVFELVQSIVVLAIFSGVAILNFYRLNFESLTGSSRLLHYYFAVLAIALAGSLAAKIAFRSVPAFRIILVAAATSFMVFSYGEIKALVGSDSAGLSIACWAFATILVGFVVGILSRRAALLPTMTLVGLVYIVPATISLVEARSRHLAAGGTAALSLTARKASNVYWIVLDGYPRADVLQQFFDFDNEPFLKGLRDLKFVVSDHAVASFPETIFSISSTLSMGFPVNGAGSSTRMLPVTELYPIVRGQSIVVNTIRSMGYRYIHFQNGYDNLTQCPKEEAVCIKGNVKENVKNVQFDEFDVALLSKTPLIDIIARGNAYGAIDETPFLRGSVHDLTDKLSEVQAYGGPFFLYAHILAPHPPIRFRSDCSTRTAAPDLLSWDPAEKSAFLEQLSCVNSEAIDLVGKITRSDPEAIIVLQSDHGTAFRGQFKKPFDAWNELDVKERFGALNTVRMPASCSNEAQGSIDLVNTFAHVLSCISGTSLPDKLARLFVVSHDGDMTNVHEYHRDF